jgi:hypothetical protein
MKPSFRAVMMTVLACALAGVPARAVEPQPPLTKKEVKTLIQTAKAPEDHMKLAAYYRFQAKKLEAEAKDHEEMGEEYYKNPTAHVIPKYPTMGQHCRDLAYYYGQAAKKNADLATLHEQMAKNVK